MIAEIISVGTELLLGQIIDTDAVMLAQALSALGINIYHRSTVGDNPERMRSTIAMALQRSDVVITIGGIGPTMDDLSREMAAEVLGVPLIMDVSHKSWLATIAEARGISNPPESFTKQALIPSMGRAIPNPNGTALGAIFESGDKIIICLPGPPNEFVPMVETSVVPYLSENLTGQRTVLKSRTLRFVGIGEPFLEDAVKDLMISANPTVAPYAKSGEVHLRITAQASTADEANEMLTEREAEIRTRVQPWLYGIDDETLEQVIVKHLIAKGIHVAVSESCTGGLIAKRITNIPDASKIFDLGVVAYSNTFKENILGVRHLTLTQYGAVSPQTAAEMAEGIRNAAAAEIGLSSTGIAGPGGGSPEKPVGTVYLGLSTPQGTVIEHNHFLGERTHVSLRAAQAALALLRKYLLFPNELTYQNPSA